jgi:cation:H+ antiporter
MDEFLLVQWVAPLASESPEFAVAWLLALRGRMSKGLLLLVSSKVNQWTLLVGTLPVVTTVAAGEPRHLPLDPRQQGEIFLTAAQSLFGVAVLANMRLNRTQAMLLAMLFMGQIFVTEARDGFTVVYMIGAVGVMILMPSSRTQLARSIKVAIANIRGKTIS